MQEQKVEELDEEVRRVPGAAVVGRTHRMCLFFVSGSRASADRVAMRRHLVQLKEIFDDDSEEEALGDDSDEDPDFEFRDEVQADEDEEFAAPEDEEDEEYEEAAATR